MSLLDDEIYVRIDTAVPHLWLPRGICDRFEQAFGLSYDNHTGLYRILDEARTKLSQQSPTITFSLGASLNPDERVNIVLPYAALDLQASYPVYPHATNSFPIRRAENATELVLGRALLQEAYVVADYGRGNYSIHQALFPRTTDPKQIITITDPKRPIIANTTGTPVHQSSKVPKKTIIGTSVGVVFTVFVVSLLAVVFHRRRRQQERVRRKMEQVQNESLHSREVPEGNVAELRNCEQIAQVDSEPLYEMHERERELDGKSSTSFVTVVPEPGVPLGSTGSIHELPADSR